MFPGSHAGEPMLLATSYYLSAETALPERRRCPVTTCLLPGPGREHLASRSDPPDSLTDVYMWQR